MKRNLSLVRVAVCLLIPVVGFAAPHEHLNWGSQTSQAQCGPGPLVINVVQKVVNDDDSGVGGNAWAKDDFVRQIQVVQTGVGTFCATVSYQGTFTTLAGLSPQNTGTIAAGVLGAFQGGYISNFTATLSANPTARRQGNIGTYDYQCDGSFNCPGYVDWTTLYFNNGAGAAVDFGWWGWVYHAGNNGSWVNEIAPPGNSGDITGS